MAEAHLHLDMGRGDLDSGHCCKGTCGMMEQQDPEVPQCPSTTDPWIMPLDTAELPLGCPGISASPHHQLSLPELSSAFW